MTPEELKSIAIEMYGDEKRWRSRLAKDLGVDYSTVKRWAAGAFEISNPVSIAVRCLLWKRQYPGTKTAKDIKSDIRGRKAKVVVTDDLEEPKSEPALKGPLTEVPTIADPFDPEAIRDDPETRKAQVAKEESTVLPTKEEDGEEACDKAVSELIEYIEAAKGAKKEDR